MEQTTVSLIEEWAANKGILAKATPKDQFVKMAEELGEIAGCLAKGSPVEDLELEIGDLGVTAIILATLKGTDFDTCLERAYAKISKRNGKMVDGVFIKEGD